MRKAIYAFGIATFLAMLIFTIATSLTNPFYGMSEAAIAQATTTTTTTYGQIPYWSTDMCWRYGMYSGCYEEAHKCAWDGFNVCTVSNQEFCADLCE